MEVVSGKGTYTAGPVPVSRCNAWDKPIISIRGMILSASTCMNKPCSTGTAPDTAVGYETEGCSVNSISIWAASVDNNYRHNTAAELVFGIEVNSEAGVHISLTDWLDAGLYADWLCSDWWAFHEKLPVPQLLAEKSMSVLVGPPSMMSWPSPNIHKVYASLDWQKVLNALIICRARHSQQMRENL